MKNQHTPGPWRVVCASAHEFNPETTRKDIIGKCQFGDAYVAGDISENDAHLIAAAPDLLAALRLMLTREMPPEGSLDWKIDNGRRMQALAAIAKAEGVK